MHVIIYIRYSIMFDQKTYNFYYYILLNMIQSKILSQIMEFELSDPGQDFGDESLLIPFRLTQSAPNMMASSSQFQPNLKTTRLWSAFENETLLKIVPDTTKRNWNEIANQLSQMTNTSLKSASQVSQHYRRTILADKRNWTQEEDDSLLHLVQHNGNQWSVIAQNFVGRSDLQVKYRYKCISK